MIELKNMLGREISMWTWIRLLENNNYVELNPLIPDGYLEKNMREDVAFV